MCSLCHDLSVDSATLLSTHVWSIEFFLVLHRANSNKNSTRSNWKCFFAWFWKSNQSFVASRIHHCGSNLSIFTLYSMIMYLNNMARGIICTPVDFHRRLFLVLADWQWDESLSFRQLSIIYLDLFTVESFFARRNLCLMESLLTECVLDVIMTMYGTVRFFLVIILDIWT